MTSPPVPRRAASRPRSSRSKLTGPRFDATTTGDSIARMPPVPFGDIAAVYPGAVVRSPAAAGDERPRLTAHRVHRGRGACRRRSGKTSATRPDPRCTEPACHHADRRREPGRDDAGLEVLERSTGHDQDEDRREPAAEAVRRRELCDRRPEDRADPVIGRAGRAKSNASGRLAPTIPKARSPRPRRPLPRSPPSCRYSADPSSGQSTDKRADRRRREEQADDAGPRSNWVSASTGNSAAGIPKIIATRSITKVDATSRFPATKANPSLTAGQPTASRRPCSGSIGRISIAATKSPAYVHEIDGVRGASLEADYDPRHGRAHDRDRLPQHLVQGQGRQEEARRRLGGESSRISGVLDRCHERRHRVRAVDERERLAGPRGRPPAGSPPRAP